MLLFILKIQVVCYNTNKVKQNVRAKQAVRGEAKDESISSN